MSISLFNQLCARYLLEDLINFCQNFNFFGFILFYFILYFYLLIFRIINFLFRYEVAKTQKVKASWLSSKVSISLNLKWCDCRETNYYVDKIREHFCYLINLCSNISSVAIHFILIFKMSWKFYYISTIAYFLSVTSTYG